MGTATILFIPLMDCVLLPETGEALCAKTSEYHRDSSRCLRTSIMLAWIAVEGAVGYEFKKIVQAGHQGRPPARLGDKLCLLLQQKSVTLDLNQFRERRAWRNRIAHPSDTTTYVAPTLEQAQLTFDYCLGLMRTFYSGHLLLE
jgi:hypothetical protein